MPQQLRVVDTQREHPIEIARRAVKEFRLDRDDPERPLPVSNQVHSGAPRLAVDEVIKQTEREMKQETRSRRSSVSATEFRYALMVLFILLASMGAMIIIAEALR